MRQRLSTAAMRQKETYTLLRFHDKGTLRFAVQKLQREKRIFRERLAPPTW